jgi:hypothetical protein
MQPFAEIRIMTSRALHISSLRSYEECRLTFIKNHCHTTQHRHTTVFKGHRQWLRGRPGIEPGIASSFDTITPNGGNKRPRVTSFLHPCRRIASCLSWLPRIEACLKSFPYLYRISAMQKGTSSDAGER